MSIFRSGRSGPDILTGLKRLSLGTVRGVCMNINTLLTWRPGLKDGAEVLLLALTLPVYYLVRGQASEHVGEAALRGVHVINLEKSLGIFWEVDLQRAILSYDWLVHALNAFYLYGHLPVIGALAIWLYFWHRPQYLLMRNAFLISGVIGLIIYLSFPVAPPRLLDDHGFFFGFVDTVVEQYHKGRPLTPGFFVNQYAAMPSLHFGWNMLVGLSAWLATRNILVRAFAVLMPFAMFTDIILTANHYILDGVMALPVVLLGITITLAGRWLVVRVVSPDSKVARENGWVSWLYWLCGIPDSPETEHHAGQPA